MLIFFFQPGIYIGRWDLPKTSLDLVNLGPQSSVCNLQHYIWSRHPVLERCAICLWQFATTSIAQHRPPAAPAAPRLKIWPTSSAQCWPQHFLGQHNCRTVIGGDVPCKFCSPTFSSLRNTPGFHFFLQRLSRMDFSFYDFSTIWNLSLILMLIRFCLNPLSFSPQEIFTSLGSSDKKALK